MSEMSTTPELTKKDFVSYQALVRGRPIGAATIVEKVKETLG